MKIQPFVKRGRKFIKKNKPKTKRFIKENRNQIIQEAILIVLLIGLLLILVLFPRVAHATSGETGRLVFDIKEPTPICVPEKVFPIKVRPLPPPPPPEPVVIEPGRVVAQYIVQPKVSNYTGSVWELGKQMCIARFGPVEFEYFNDLVGRESGWNPRARNASSGAYGLGQALPASKMAPYGDIHSPEVQLRWMFDYISGRYGTPSNAIAFHNSHNWY